MSIHIEDREIKIVERMKDARQKLLKEISKVIIGQIEIVEQVLICILSRGHALIEGVPGLAKTLLIRTIANTLNLNFKRIQFTPDLMPSDIIGTEIIEETTPGKREFRFLKGPIFANIVLADEINRAPPKTQAALLEAMQEYRVSVAGKTYFLEQPFFVLATQNPIEQEGTYPLPEAQLDRFMFKILIDYPEESEEKDIIKTPVISDVSGVENVLTGEEILALQNVVKKIPISDHVLNYGMSIIRLTRPSSQAAPDFIKNWVRWGAGPRAGQYMMLAARAMAVMRGSVNVSCEDVRKVAYPVLRHRIIPNFTAEAEGVDSTQIIKRLISTVPEPSY